MFSSPDRRRTAATLAASCVLAGAAVVAASAPAQATPVARQQRIANTDWTSAAVGGIGSAASGGGSGTIRLTGVRGTITHAYLAWNGLGGYDATLDDYVGAYDNPHITVDGTAVTGISQGESGSNCWSDHDATTRSYLADVTGIVKAHGNGSYTLAGLGDGGDADGAHLVVTYDDGVASNNRDLYLFYGDNSNQNLGPDGNFDPNGFTATLAGLNYQGGNASVQLAVADGQKFFSGSDDGQLNFSGPGGGLSIVDDSTSHNGLWDGTSVPDAGHSRADTGSLYDLENFDISRTFARSGVQTLNIGQPRDYDCFSLVMAAVSLRTTAGQQPPVPQSVSVEPGRVIEGTRRRPITMPFRVTLATTSFTETTVSLRTFNGTEAGQAQAPADYTSTTQTIVLRPQQTTAYFQVPVMADSTPEAAEHFYAIIESASVPIATGTAVGQIIDDDQPSTSAHSAPNTPGARVGGGRSAGTAR